MRARLAAIACTMTVAACGSSDSPEDGDWRAERTTIGDTTVVRTLSGSVWQEPLEAVVELTIGTAEGPEETMFGAVTRLTPDGAGGIYIYDQQMPAIRQFDAQGQFVRQVGRKGQGPGEYLDAILGMALRSDGRLQILDPRNRRVTIFEPDGSWSEQWRIANSLFTADAMFLDRSDHTYIKDLMEEPVPDKPWRIGLLHHDDHGTLLDSIPDPAIAGEPESENSFLGPSKIWTFGRDASLVVGVNSTYQFEIRGADGRVVRVARDVQPSAVSDAEHAAYEASREYLIRIQGEYMTSLPKETRRVKPAYRDLFLDDSARVWVQLYGPVVPDPEYVPAAEDQPPKWPFLEQRQFDVFEPDGTYLGQVVIPDRVRVLNFGSDVLWGIREGDQGQVELVRMRLQPRRPTAGTD
ncbi:MAG: 6-bladed beta-propeller [Gemmatimonadales bacterium]|nr:6-bladed beta-propeller [Gemmatimonadales bacterium]